MFNPKSTIYQTEWLDLVFADRNKSYGAYELRQNYNRRLFRALCIASSFVVILFSYPFLQRYLGSDADVVNDLPLQEQIFVLDLPQKILKQDVPVPEPAKARPSKPVKTIRSVPPVAVSTPVAEDPPRNVDLMNAAIGPQTTEGAATTTNVSPVDNTEGGGAGTGTDTNGDEPVNVSVLEKYPEFPGGMEGFSKYLQKNLRYPVPAIEAGVMGKVFVTFIVERDGRLTDIKVIRGLGYGCDQEAERVLKKSPVWSPGIQNNRAVRVQYTIPLMFQLSE